MYLMLTVSMRTDDRRLGLAGHGRRWAGDVLDSEILKYSGTALHGALFWFVLRGSQGLLLSKTLKVLSARHQSHPSLLHASP